MPRIPHVQLQERGKEEGVVGQPMVWGDALLVAQYCFFNWAKHKREFSLYVITLSHYKILATQQHQQVEKFKAAYCAVKKLVIKFVNV